ncbi:MAG: DHH family phosphoesterase [Clostridia bacterium]|nr:DHH family phosphoesterase [Clostridia bacterium]
MSKINETREKIWNIIYSRSDEADAVVENLSQKCDIKPVTAKLLYNRGYRTPEEVRSLLNNETSILRDPFGIIDLDKAVERIHDAVEKNEKIVIYGDYDVDGVTSVSCLYLFLRAKGAEVDYYIPTRDGEGYGLSCAAVEKFAAQGVNLIITVDTGITAYEEAALAARNGIDMVITDHHECRSVLPDAVAVVNPHRLDCKYPFKELAGVGVVSSCSVLTK